MLVEEELAREMPTKATNWNNNYCNKDKKDNVSTSKKVRALHCYTKYTCIKTTYTQAL